MKKVLAGIQDKLHSSKKKVTWATVFVALLMLSMTTESLQVAVRGKEATDKREGILMQGDGTATTTIEKMEERLNFLIRLYRKKYGATEEREMTFNPLKNHDAYNSLGPPDQDLAHKIRTVTDTYRREPPNPPASRMTLISNRWFSRDSPVIGSTLDRYRAAVLATSCQVSALPLNSVNTVSVRLCSCTQALQCYVHDWIILDCSEVRL